MDYQGNSDKKKQEKANPTPKKSLEKVVKGDVVKAKPTLGDKFKEIFLGGDMVATKRYVVGEVLLPAIRNLIVDIVVKGTDRAVYGDTARRRPGPTSYAPRVQYNNPVSRGTPIVAQSRPWAPTVPARRGIDDLILATKEDADNVVESLTTVVDQYEIVSVADLNEMLGLPSPHTDHKWGWTNLSSIEVRQVREGWRITLPPVEEIQ